MVFAMLLFISYNSWWGVSWLDGYVCLLDSLDERKQCNLRDLARMHASKTLVILRMSISRQRCLRNNLSWVINILTKLFKCEVKSTTSGSVWLSSSLSLRFSIEGIWRYIFCHLYVTVFYIVLCIIQRKTATWPPTHRLVHVAQITKRLLRYASFFFSWWYQWWWGDRMCCDWQSNRRESMNRATYITGLKYILRYTGVVV